MNDIRTVAVIGTGVIGAGWAARCLAYGLDVVAWDPGDGWQQRLRTAVENAWPALVRLGLYKGASIDRLRFAESVEEACSDADFVQEAAPERIELKTALHAQMDTATRPHVPIASSTSGLLPSEFQADCSNPQRILVGHPFNPVYLLPLVEVLGGEKTGAQALDEAVAFYESIGMYPLRVRSEIPGFLSDRLQEALWREVLHLVNDGVATTEELDAAIAYGPGLRWSIWGTCLIFHLAGGEGGMRHMLDHFDPTQFPWTKLDPPPITEALVERMAKGCEAQTGGRSIKELERLRDDCLIAVMQALRAYRVGAGEVLQKNAERRTLQREYQRWTANIEVPTPLALYDCHVRPEWIDYNGHMTESEYLAAFGGATDALFRYIGIDEDYRAAGQSFYTVESHLNFLREARAGDALRFTTQVLAVDDKRLHFFHQVLRGEELLATTEQMLLHVDAGTARACTMQPHIRQALDAIAAAHGTMPTPPQVGHQMSLVS
ncbi:MAG: L-carnitine dehydrogenase [Gammaproteobacteria bacterium]|nr:L-carnitine dehydrogenase [Gammaproteobacteria bacterium]